MVLVSHCLLLEHLLTFGGCAVPCNVYYLLVALSPGTVCFLSLVPALSELLSMFIMHHLQMARAGQAASSVEPVATGFHLAELGLWSGEETVMRKKCTFVFVFSPPWNTLGTAFQLGVSRVRHLWSR